MIHATCVQEEGEKHRPEVLPLSSPLLHFIHGLPGSGKTQVLTWVRTYFEDVWNWKDEEEEEES